LVAFSFAVVEDDDRLMFGRAALRVAFVAPPPIGVARNGGADGDEFALAAEEQRRFVALLVGYRAGSFFILAALI
jgi:hypothetical protein